MKYNLENWVIYGNVLVGRVHGYPGIPNGSPMFSGALINPVEAYKPGEVVETLSKHKDIILKFKLGEPGSLEQYQHVNFSLKPEERNEPVLTISR